MAEPLKISTANYNKQGKVEVDGHIWTVRLPGAGTELRLSQAMRSSKLYGSRISLLDKKIDNKEITEAELDKYEEYAKKYEENEQAILSFFTGIFQDDTPDNSEVKQWVEDTPTAIIEMAFTDIKEQSNGADSGRTEPTESA